MTTFTDNSPPTTSSSLKIAIVHYACAPVVGGVESVMSTHARWLERAGHRPYIVAGRGDPHSAGIPGEIIPELDSRHPDIVKTQNALRSGEQWAQGEFKLWTERIYERLGMLLCDFDICIVHNAFTLHKNLPLTVALARLAEESALAEPSGGQAARSPKWIAWCHDFAWNNPLYQDELLPQWPWTPLKYALPNVEYVTVSERRRQEMAGLFKMSPAEIALVPNGIEPTAFIPCSPDMAEIREHLRWDERDCVLLTPVRITRRKNLELAIDIVGGMCDLGVRPLLVVTGPIGPHNVRSGEYLHELVQRREARGLQNEVCFLALEGPKSRDRGSGVGDRGSETLDFGHAGPGAEPVSDALMAELYWWADALLLPSEQEGFGLPLLEAGLARLPIFCSDIPVMHEVGGEHATYFPPNGDPDEIAATIIRALSEPGAAAYRRKVLSGYSWEAVVRSYLLPLVEGIVKGR